MSSDVSVEPSRTDFLERVPYFAGLSRSELERLCERLPDVTVEAGTALFEQDDASDSVYVVLEGEFEVTRHEAGRAVVLGRAGPGDVLGEIALLADTPRSATATAASDARVVAVDRAALDELLANPTAVRAMLQTVVARLRQTESTIQQVEKMAALGTMAAGILHELNNPAAAVQRGAALLAEQLPSLWEVEDDLAAAGVTPPAAVEEKSPPADPIERADREDALAAWLEDLGVTDAWDVANVLVGDGWDVDRLAAAGVDAGSPHAASLVRALALRTQAVSLLDEIRVGAARLSDLVGAVKRYTHVGEAPVGPVDIEASLRDTLIVMRHQLGGIDVVEDFAPDLPPVDAHGSELSQVWTNLIDNAADAMGGEGTLTLRTSTDRRWVVVEIGDTGPGMPPDVRDRIFEPFFTTKEPGQGTGLGLHTVHQLVTRNGGAIDLDTSPDGTTFRVRLPVATDGKSA